MKHSSSAYSYEGTELELFREAVNWKSYWSRVLRPHLFGRLLEVGAGIGANLPYLACPPVKSIVALEPDPYLSSQIPAQCNEIKIQTITGLITDLSSQELFDCIVYIDVLEHIVEDALEVQQAWKHLKPGGIFAFLSPSLMSLWSPFDQAVGHQRRYTLGEAKALLPDNHALIKLLYLDCVGTSASIANRLLLRQSNPTIGQIKTWDSFMVSISTWVDPLFINIWGRSLLCISRKQ